MSSIKLKFRKKISILILLWRLVISNSSIRIKRVRLPETAALYGMVQSETMALPGIFPVVEQGQQNCLLPVTLTRNFTRLVTLLFLMVVDCQKSVKDSRHYSSQKSWQRMALKQKEAWRVFFFKKGWGGK